jgi:hypothetical protein
VYKRLLDWPEFFRDQCTCFAKYFYKEQMHPNTQGYSLLMPDQ